MKFDTSYALQEFREEQPELFNKEGVAFDRMSHKEPMTRMLTLINLLESELPTKERIINILQDFSVQDPSSNTYEQRMVRDNDFEEVANTLLK